MGRSEYLIFFYIGEIYHALSSFAAIFIYKSVHYHLEGVWREC